MTDIQQALLDKFYKQTKIATTELFANMVQTVFMLCGIGGMSTDEANSACQAIIEQAIIEVQSSIEKKKEEEK